MYVDCDSCTVGYGTDVTYYGSPIRFPKENLPVYAMIGCMCENAQITMIYRGSGKKNTACCLLFCFKICLFVCSFDRLFFFFFLFITVGFAVV